MESPMPCLIQGVPWARLAHCAGNRGHSGLLLPGGAVRRPLLYA